MSMCHIVFSQCNHLRFVSLYLRGYLDQVSNSLLTIKPSSRNYGEFKFQLSISPILTVTFKKMYLLMSKLVKVDWMIFSSFSPWTFQVILRAWNVLKHQVMLMLLAANVCLKKKSWHYCIMCFHLCCWEQLWSVGGSAALRGKREEAAARCHHAPFLFWPLVGGNKLRLSSDRVEALHIAGLQSPEHS